MPRPLRSPHIAVLPAGVRPWAADAVREAGAIVVPPAEAEALVWMATGFEDSHGPKDLMSLLRSNPGIGWVQLPWAGVEPYAAAGVLDEAHLWTSGKGVYARPVAEHALALALAGTHHLKAYSEARNWTSQAGVSLSASQVTIIGGGGVVEELLRLLEPFHCRITVVRRHPSPMPGVDAVLGWEDRDLALARASVVFLALALTPETDGFFARPQFELMADDGWLINVARGRHVVTDDLEAALREGLIGGAALDVTEPEPLPGDHALWRLPNCLITPHTANTYEMAVPLLMARITDNIQRYASGQELLGTVDPALGY